MQSSFQLLTTTLRAGFHSQAKPELKSIIEQANDEIWTDFMILADHHNVSNLSRSSFRKNDLWESLPGSVQQTLEERYHNCVAWSLKLSHSLEEVIPAFEEAGIPIIPWKGPALSQRLFENIWNREYMDLDCLVPSQHQSKIENVLQDLGYDHSESDSTEPTTNLANNNDHCQAWQHQINRTELEIHWKPFPGAFRFTPRIEDLLPRCSPSPFRSISISQLSLEDEFILLAGHGAKHHWIQLNWLCDFAHFIQQYGSAMDWNEINATARQTGLVRIIKTAMLLIEDLFQVTPPTDSFDHPRTDYIACRLAAGYTAQLQKNHPSSLTTGFSWKFYWMIHSMLSRERYRDRLPALLSTLAYIFTPNHRDRESCPKSFPFSFFAWIIRPFRLILKYALRPSQKNSTLS